MSVTEFRGMAPTLGTGNPDTGEVATLAWAQAPGAGQNQLYTNGFNDNPSTIVNGNLNPETIGTFGAAQLAIGVKRNAPALSPNCYLWLKWWPDDKGVSVDGFYDSSMTAQAVANAEQRWVAARNAWQLVPGCKLPILVPAAFHFFSIGVYAEAALSGGEVVNVVVERCGGGVTPIVH